MKTLSNIRILIFVGDEYEDLELWYSKLRLEEAGAAVILAGQAARHTYHGKNGYPCESEVAIAEVRSSDVDGVVLVGGWMPDKLRRDPKVLELIGDLNKSGKLIAAICHGPWMSISAGICKGVRMTSTPGIKDDLTNAGAIWSDEPVVIDRHHITSRRPPDLPAFMEHVVAFLSK